MKLDFWEKEEAFALSCFLEKKSLLLTAPNFHRSGPTLRFVVRFALDLQAAGKGQIRN